MQSKYRKYLLAVLTSLTLTIVMSFGVITSFAAGDDQSVGIENGQQTEGVVEALGEDDPIVGEELTSTVLNGGDVVSEDGVYTFAENATGIITIKEGLKVTLVGKNYDAETNSFPTNYKDLNIVVGTGSELTIEDLYITQSEKTDPAIEFAGSGKLFIAGHNLIDRPDGYGNGAIIHVGEDSSVTFDGDGVLWGYKHAAGAYIGSNSGEKCGNITINGGTYFLKASKTGALIGQDSADDPTGKITINGGTLYLKVVAQGAALGASRQGSAPDVEINGGQIEIVTDYSGSAIGCGGGHGSAGALTVNGGSLRTIATQNAYGSWGIDPDNNKGAVLTDANVTAKHTTKMLAFDATKYEGAKKISVYVDGNEDPFYQGGLYEFCTNEVKNPKKPYENSTMCNWLPNTKEFSLVGVEYLAGAYPSTDDDSSVIGSQLAGDNTLVFQLEKEEHLLIANGDRYIALYDEDANAFDLNAMTMVAATASTCTVPGNIEYWKNDDGSLLITFGEDGSWKTVTAEDVALPLADHNYGENGICTECGALDPNVEEIIVESADDLKTVAALVNGGNDLTGKVVTLANDIDLGSEAWTPIGNGSYAFAGTFDGTGKTISGLSLAASNGYGGLFGNNSGTVKDFTVKGQYGSESEMLQVSGDCFAGAVAYNKGTVEGVVSEVDMYLSKGDGYAIGGVVGRNDGGTVTKCGNDGAISCDTSKSFYRVGGVVGHMTNNGTISESYNKARIEAWNYRNGCQGVGGILGSLDTNGTVSYCYNMGTVHDGKGDSGTGGKQGVGGIVGAINAGNVDHCYATANTYGPASCGVLVGKVGNGTYSNLYYLNTARGYQQYGTQTDAETGLKYCDGNDENADGSLKFGGGGIANSYNGGYTISDSFTKTHAEMIDPAFATLLGDKFQAQCGYPALAWETPKVHVEGEPQDTETIAATYDEGEYHYSVTLCTECGLELSRSDKIYTSDSLKTQAEDAIAAATDALTTANELAAAAAQATGEDAAAAAQEALEAAAAAKEAAVAAQQAAQNAYDAASEEQKAEAQGFVDAANAANTAAEQAVADASAMADKALEEANTIKELKDAATLSMATLNQTVNKSLYKASTYAPYKAAIDAFKEVVKSGSSTKQQVIDARADITKAYVALVEKDANTLKAKGKTVKVKFKALKKKAQTVAVKKAFTVSKNIGKVTYKKTSGNKKITVASTGKITVKKGLKKGTYKVKVKVTAAGNGEYKAGSKAVTVTIKVK